MYKYRNENAFKHALIKHFESCGYRSSVIETGPTCIGVPDLYVDTPHYDYWLELKRIHCLFDKNRMYTIPWRKGQQGWMLRKYRITKRPAFTLVAFDNCIVSICMNKRYNLNTIRGIDATSVWDRVSSIQL
jgi:hypothetical protein